LPASAATLSASGAARHRALDWLRVAVVLNLFPLHVAWLICYVPDYSTVPEDCPGRAVLTGYVIFFTSWHMPLLFFIAGVTACLSLGKRAPSAFLKERIERLLAPLVCFALAGYPLMTYFLPGAGEPKGVADFLLRYWPLCLSRPWDNWFSDGRPAVPTWGHLWFVAYLLVISVVTLPLLLWLRRRLAGRSPDLPAPWFVGVLGFVLPVAALALVRALLAPQWPMFIRCTLVGDWTYFAYNLVAFLCGAVYSLAPRFFEPAVGRYRGCLLLGAVCSAAVIVLRLTMREYTLPAYTPVGLAYSCLFGLTTWTWIVGLVGLGRRFLTAGGPVLDYLNRTSYVFYIVHLVVMTPIGYGVARLQLGLLIELTLVMLLSVVGTVAFYELLVRRNPIGRIALGVKS
jgi:peptidoglycan/LPS O-acetylase OafA/YrhL